MNILERTRIEKLVLEHGWENILTSHESRVIAGSARHNAQVTITRSTSNEWLITFNKPLLTKALAQDFKQTSDCTTFSIETSDQIADLLRKAAKLASVPTNVQATEIFHARVESELSNIQNTATEVERLVKQRVGQNTYREALMDYWSGACAVTGVAIPEILRASHAKPWAKCESDEERLDVYNGFLLSANLDALFDRGLISFDEQGKIMISGKLSVKQISLLGINQRMALRRIEPEHGGYLGWHRQYWFQENFGEVNINLRVHSDE